MKLTVCFPTKEIEVAVDTFIFAASYFFFSSKTFREREKESGKKNLAISTVWRNEDRHHNSLSHHKSHSWVSLFTGLSSWMSASSLLSRLKQDQIHRKGLFDSYYFFCKFLLALTDQELYPGFEFLELMLLGEMFL